MILATMLISITDLYRFFGLSCPYLSIDLQGVWMLAIPRFEEPPKKVGSRVKINCMEEYEKQSDQITCNLFYDYQQIYQQICYKTTPPQ